MDTFKGIPSSSIGTMGLNSLILQDDISRVNDTLEQAKNGCELLDDTLKSKLLSANYSKSKFLVVGSKKFRKETMEELKSNPLTMSGVTIEHSDKEKYLGDMIHESGCKESISETIKARTNGLVSKTEDIIAISENPVMGGTGNSLAAIKLFEAQIIPALLFNCESWIGITEKHYDTLDAFQDAFIRKLLRLPKSTPKAILHWDSGLRLMRWRIAERKLRFLGKLIEKDENNIARKAVLNEVIMELKGLAYECQVVSEKIGLPNVMYNKVTKSEIKRKITEAELNEKRSEMLNSTKCGDRMTDNPMDNSYLSYLSLPHSRIWMRYRARSIAGVKANVKNNYRRRGRSLNCRFCDDASEETQEHLEVCRGTDHERRGLNLTGWFGKLNFWKRMTKKLSAAVT